MGRGRKNNRNRRTTGRVHIKAKNRSRFIKKSATFPALKESWDPTKSVRQNYEQLGLVLDANHPSGADASSSVPELLSLPVEPRKKRAPVFAETEKTYLLTLQERYGSDYERMFRDTKLNNKQLTANQLKKRFALMRELEQSSEAMEAEE